jgi:hypothetical protein
MPTEIALPMPPGDATALTDLVRDVRAAASCLAVVDERLVGAAASAPGWLGDDAAAAATQIGTVTGLVGALSEALVPAIARLDAHAERLLETRRQVAALKDEQDEEFAEAWGRLGRVADVRLQVMTGGAEVRAIVEEVETGEASRRRRHTALMEDLEDDATATARVLADSCAVVGGRGRSGDANRVVAYLAAQLPGWGDLELTRRGQVLAGRLTAGTPEERAGNAADAIALAGSAAFANALLAGLGEEGAAYLFRDLGYATFGTDDSVARLLAGVFGAAVPNAPHDPVEDVLTAVYVRADDRNGDASAVAAGLAIVLTAGLSVPSGGVQTRTVAEWSRQLLLWEHAQDMRVGMRPADAGSTGIEPTALAIGILADRADPAVAAALIDDTRVWEALLIRDWGDGGAALGRIITQAGQETGTPGDQAVQTGLHVIGAGLAADDPAEWTVNRNTVATIAPALGGAAAAHISVAVDALQVGVDGRLSGGRGDVARGLGYVTLDRDAAARIDRALDGWALVQPRALDGTTSNSPLPVVAVPSAFLAVQHWAQRSDHALDALQAREEAENRKQWWGMTTGMYVQLIPGYLGIAAGVLEGEAAILAGADGTWENEADRGLRFDRDDAATAALSRMLPQQAADAQAVTRQAHAAFDRTATALGERRAPQSAESDPLEPVLGGLIEHARERTDSAHGRRIRLPR